MSAVMEKYVGSSNDILRQFYATFIYTFSMLTLFCLNTSKILKYTLMIYEQTIRGIKCVFPIKKGSKSEEFYQKNSKNSLVILGCHKHFEQAQIYAQTCNIPLICVFLSKQNIQKQTTCFQEKIMRNNDVSFFINGNFYMWVTENTNEEQSGQCIFYKGSDKYASIKIGQLFQKNTKQILELLEANRDKFYEGQQTLMNQRQQNQDLQMEDQGEKNYYGKILNLVKFAHGLEQDSEDQE